MEAAPPIAPPARITGKHPRPNSHLIPEHGRARRVQQFGLAKTNSVSESAEDMRRWGSDFCCFSERSQRAIYADSESLASAPLQQPALSQAAPSLATDCHPERSKITREANDPAKSRDLLSAYIATDERPSLFRSHRHAPCGDSRLGCPSLGAARRPLPHCRPPADKSE